jgi:hypothetical protein
MSRAKQASKRRSRTKAVTVLGVAGALSLAGGGPSRAAVAQAGDTPTERMAPVVTLSEEEISDVSLATFYVFDKENAEAHPASSQLARSHSRGRGSAVRRGCAGCAACAVACGGGGGCASCASSGGPDGM